MAAARRGEPEAQPQGSRTLDPPFSVLVHEEVWRELSPDRYSGARASLQATARSRVPARAAGVRSVHGSSFPHAYRLRVGAWRLMFALFPDQRTIYVTTAFRKKRESDYVAALRRHDMRVREHE